MSRLAGASVVPIAICVLPDELPPEVVAAPEAVVAEPGAVVAEPDAVVVDEPPLLSPPQATASKPVAAATTATVLAHRARMCAVSLRARYAGRPPSWQKLTGLLVIALTGAVTTARRHDKRGTRRVGLRPAWRARRPARRRQRPPP